MSKLNLYEASHQWANRPADERFASLKEMYDACLSYAKTAREADVPYRDLRVEKVGDDLQLVGKTGVPARLTHHAFGQLSSLAGAPANYLRRLPATLAAQNINHGLAERNQNINDAKALFHQNGSLILRAITSTKYERIWNYEVAQRLMGLEADGWQVPPARPAFSGQTGVRPATENDVLSAGKSGLSIKVGDMIAPAGLYASDHDMFAFLVYEKNRIDNGTDTGLARGVMFSNSEVGDAAIKRTTFLYEYVCGNHIIWGAEDVKTISIAHVGTARANMGELLVEIEAYGDTSAAADEAGIRRAQTKVIGKTKDEVLDFMFDLKIRGLNRKSVEDAYDLAVVYEKQANAAPNTAYGIVHGLTRVSQLTPYADERAALDLAAGRVMKIIF